MSRRLSCLLIFFCLCLQAVSQNYTSRLFSTDQGLPDAYIYNIVQDDAGFLWIATGKGLVRFDGQVFKNYDLHAEESDDIVYSGVLDNNKDLWFGTFSGKIYKLDKKRDQLKKYSGHINGSVNKIISHNKNGRLYFFSKGNGIYCLDKNRLLQLQGTKDYEINCIATALDDGLVLGTSEGLVTLDLRSMVFTNVRNFEFGVKQIQKLNGGEGYVCATAGSGLYALRITNYSATAVQDLTTYQDFPGGEITAFYFNEKTRLLHLGTSEERFVTIDLEDKNIQQIGENDFLAIANSVFVDTESDIWISTTGKGLYRLKKTEFEFLAIDGKAIFAITEDHKGRMYYGTKEGIILAEPGGAIIKNIENVAGKKLGKINTLFFDGRLIWIGAATSGLTVMEVSNFSPVKVQFSSVQNLAINAITGNSSDNEIHVCTNLDGIYIYTSTNLKQHLSVQNSLLHNNIYYALKTKNKRVYYATHNTGFNFSMNEREYEINTSSNGLISDFNSFAEDKTGDLAIGTNGDGVYFLNDTVIHRFEFNDKLGSKFCNGLVYDNSENLWIMQRYGLYKYFPKSNTLKRAYSNDHLLFNNNAVFKSKNGDLFFGTSRDVMVYENNTESLNVSKLPKSYIISVSLFDSLIKKKNNLVLKNGRYNFTFVFSSLSLKNSEEVNFTYILEGRDNHWSEPSKQRRVEFSNLEEGDYIFKIKAINSDGFSELQPASYSFSIKKPLWKTVGFWLLFVLLLGLLIFLIVRWRTAQLLRQKLKLEREVVQKTMEIRKEKQVVEINSKVIELQHHEITQSINYAKRIQEAILPVFSELADHSPEVFVYFQPKDIVSGDFYWHVEKNGRFLIAACDCTGHGVPGAFMSLIGSTLLNKIVLDKGIVDPAQILFEIDKEISVSLKQESNEVRDGMENAVCSFDFANRMLYYAGAKRPLWVYKRSESGYELQELPGNKFPIGGFADVKDKIFTQHEISISQGDTVYMFTDGIIDQFDHNNKKRLSTKRVRALLSSIVNLPMQEQEQEIARFFNGWKMETPQTDDVMVIGVRCR